MTSDLEARIQRLEDIEEIRRLRMKYHDFTNTSRFEEIPALFTEDANVDFGWISKAKGTEEIKELFARIPRNLPFLKQFIHNHLVDVDGDRASGISYMDARYAVDGESIIVAARFVEQYSRTEKGWLISDFAVEVYFSVPIEKGWAGDQMNFVKPFT